MKIAKGDWFKIAAITACLLLFVSSVFLLVRPGLVSGISSAFSALDVAEPNNPLRSKTPVGDFPLGRH
jgi:hypothetical protein